MNIITRGAIAHLTERGFRVFPPLAAPEPGTLWMPTRGRAEPRRVSWAGPGQMVTYRHPGGSQAVISLKAWHLWRQRARAKAVT